MARTPAITAAGSVIFLRDRLDRWKALAVRLAVAAVLALNLGSSGQNEGGALVLATLSSSVRGAARRRIRCSASRSPATCHPISVAAIAAVLATTIFAPFAFVQVAELDIGAVEHGDWFALAWWGFRDEWRLGRCCGIAASAASPGRPPLLSWA